MSNQAKWAIGTVAALAALALWANYRRKPATPLQVVEEVAPDNSPFYAPYYWGNPGISPNGTTGGGPTFSGDVTVNVSADALSGLTNKYIPLFGFVGVTAIGS